MKQVKIDENVYLILEKLCQEPSFIQEGKCDLEKSDRLVLARFFTKKSGARYLREKRVENYYREKRIQEEYIKGMFDED